MLHNDSDELVRIVNSCDGDIHHVTKCCDQTILIQSISIVTPSSAQYFKRNLAAPNNLMTMMSTNGKEDTKTLDNILEHCFMKKDESEDIIRILERANDNNVLTLELHDAKFTHAMHNRNRNRRFYPILGCCCQRDVSFSRFD